MVPASDEVAVVIVLVACGRAHTDEESLRACAKLNWLPTPGLWIWFDAQSSCAEARGFCGGVGCGWTPAMASGGAEEMIEWFGQWGEWGGKLRKGRPVSHASQRVQRRGHVALASPYTRGNVRIECAWRDNIWTALKLVWWEPGRTCQPNGPISSPHVRETTSRETKLVLRSWATSGICTY
jgi:hypothetical protein